MKKSILLIACLMMSATSAVFAQEEEKPLSISASLNQDAFFGFYPVISGSYALSDKLAFTTYGIMWGGGTLADYGQWTEFGVGVNYKVAGFDIIPQIGLLAGNLLSSGGAQPGVATDGFVPNLTVNYGDDLFEGQFYGGLYTALKNTKAPGETTLNYTHYWANFGVKVLKFASLGAHFEELYLSGGKTFEGTTTDKADYYRWVGPYVQFADPQGKGAIRFSTGADLTDPVTSNSKNGFYKLSMTVNF